MTEKAADMSEASHDTALLLGEFRKAIASLEKAVETQTEKSEEGRRKIYRDLEEIRKEQLITKLEVAEVKNDLKQAKPTLSWIDAWKERFTGMLILCLFVGGALGGSTVLFWKWIGKKIGVD